MFVILIIIAILYIIKVILCCNIVHFQSDMIDMHTFIDKIIFIDIKKLHYSVKGFHY